MKTANVRALRNNFADVAKWIEQGEQVSITRNGKPFATLSAAAAPKRRGIVDWVARTKRFTPVGKGLSKEQTVKVWSDIRD